METRISLHSLRKKKYKTKKRTIRGKKPHFLLHPYDIEHFLAFREPKYELNTECHKHTRQS